MTRGEFNGFCAALPATTHVVQWGNAEVWKVGGKVFAICGWADGADAFTFKVSDIAWEILRDAPGIRPAPYLASRGLKWLQHFGAPGLSDSDLRDHIAISYDLVAAGLSGKRRAELGIPQSAQQRKSEP
jgi:predicted DNA-binding protein (MmcQ/YjbR family)